MLDHDYLDTSCLECLVLMCFLIYFGSRTCSAQLKMFHVERRSRNTIVMIIILSSSSIVVVGRVVVGGGRRAVVVAAVVMVVVVVVVVLLLSRRHDTDHQISVRSAQPQISCGC